MFFIAILATSLVFLIVSSSTALGSTQNDTQGDDVQQTYTFVKKWGSQGTGDGQFQRIHDLDFDPLEKRLYVSDRDAIVYKYLTKTEHFTSNGVQRELETVNLICL
jgi:hypothetical protein